MATSAKTESTQIIQETPQIVEPVLEIHDIQGNILGGFNKDYQSFLFFEIEDPTLAKKWLAYIEPYISTTTEVLQFNKLFKSMRKRQGHDPLGLVGTWINIAFSYQALSKLVPNQVTKFQDPAFKYGMAKRSTLIGDPDDPAMEGNTHNWKLGGSGNNPDIILILASDDETRLEQVVQMIKDSLTNIPNSEPTTVSGLKLVFVEEGRTRHDLPGHEHFGFMDGISQPAVRGRLSEAESDYLTPRVIDPSDPRATYYALPGQSLVWPGEFVFGYPRQNSFDRLTPTQPESYDPNHAITDPEWYESLGIPEWAKNGSMLVVRRLRQDVELFWKTIYEQAITLGVDYEYLAASLFGRWKSGAPILRTPDKKDNPQLGQDIYANNNFNYDRASKPYKLKPEIHYDGDHFPQSVGDQGGMIAPLSAHIRKMNPRDETTDIGGESATLTRRILRRSIPYGAPLVVDPATPQPVHDSLNGNRGLMFLSYQTNIHNQFEFLNFDWANQPDQPDAGGGHDLIIGQANTRTKTERDNRSRTFNFHNKSISIPKDFVIATGGEYYFQPSISAIKMFISE